MADEEKAARIEIEVVTNDILAAGQTIRQFATEMASNINKIKSNLNVLGASAENVKSTVDRLKKQQKPIKVEIENIAKSLESKIVGPWRQAARNVKQISDYVNRQISITRANARAELSKGTGLVTPKQRTQRFFELGGRIPDPSKITSRVMNTTQIENEIMNQIGGMYRKVLTTTKYIPQKLVGLDLELALEKSITQQIGGTALGRSKIASALSSQNIPRSLTGGAVWWKPFQMFEEEHNLAKLIPTAQLRTIKANYDNMFNSIQNIVSIEGSNLKAFLKKSSTIKDKWARDIRGWQSSLQKTILPEYIPPVGIAAIAKPLSKTQLKNQMAQMTATQQQLPGLIAGMGMPPGIIGTVAGMTAQKESMKSIKDLMAETAGKAKEVSIIQKGINNLTSGWERLMYMINRHFQWIISGAVTYGSMFLIGAATVEYSEFTKQLARVKSVMRDLIPEADKIEAHILKMSRSSIFSAKELAEGLYHVGSVGLLQLNTSLSKTVPAAAKVADAMYNLYVAQKVATVGNIKMEESVKGIYAILSQYKLGAQDAGKVGSMLAYTAANSATEIHDLFGAFAKTGAAAKAFGLDMYQTAAILSKFAEYGAVTSESGRMLRNVLTRLIAPPKELQDIFSALTKTFGDNFRVVKEGEAPNERFFRIIKSLYDVLPKLTKESQLYLLSKLGLKREIIAMIALTNEETKEMKLLANKIREAAEKGQELDKQYKTIMSSFQAVSKTTMNAVMTATLSVFKAIEPVLARSMATVGVWMEQFAKFVQENPKRIQALAELVMGGIKLTLTFVALMSVLSMLKTALAGVTAVAGVLAALFTKKFWSIFTVAFGSKAAAEVLTFNKALLAVLATAGGVYYLVMKIQERLKVGAWEQSKEGISQAKKRISSKYISALAEPTPGVKIHPLAAQSYIQLASLGLWMPNIRQGFRSYQEQLNLYKVRPDVAAPPWMSLHPLGLAIDLERNLSPTKDKELLKKIRSAGWEWGGDWATGKEPWHIEYLGKTKEEQKRIQKLKQKLFSMGPKGEITEFGMSSEEVFGESVGKPIGKFIGMITNSVMSSIQTAVLGTGFKSSSTEMEKRIDEQTKFYETWMNKTFSNMGRLQQKIAESSKEGAIDLRAMVGAGKGRGVTPVDRGTGIIREVETIQKLKDELAGYNTIIEATKNKYDMLKNSLYGYSKEVMSLLIGKEEEIKLGEIQKTQLDSLSKRYEAVKKNFDAIFAKIKVMDPTKVTPDIKKEYDQVKAYMNQITTAKQKVVNDFDATREAIAKENAELKEFNDRAKEERYKILQNKEIPEWMSYSKWLEENKKKMEAFNASIDFQVETRKNHILEIANNYNNLKGKTVEAWEAIKNQLGQLGAEIKDLEWQKYLGNIANQVININNSYKEKIFNEQESLNILDKQMDRYSAIIGGISELTNIQRLMGESQIIPGERGTYNEYLMKQLGWARSQIEAGAKQFSFMGEAGVRESLSGIISYYNQIADKVIENTTKFMGVLFTPMREFLDSLNTGLEDLFTKMMDGTASFSDFLSSIGSQLKKMFAHDLAEYITGSLRGALGGTENTAGPGNLITQLFSGFTDLFRRMPESVPTPSSIIRGAISETPSSAGAINIPVPLTFPGLLPGMPNITPEALDIPNIPLATAEAISANPAQLAKDAAEQQRQAANNARQQSMIQQMLSGAGMIASGNPAALGLGALTAVTGLFKGGAATAFGGIMPWVTAAFGIGSLFGLFRDNSSALKDNTNAVKQQVDATEKLTAPTQRLADKAEGWPLPETAYWAGRATLEPGSQKYSYKINQYRGPVTPATAGGYAV